MKIKLKILKDDIKKYLPFLQKRYIMARFIVNRLESFIQKDADEELLMDWYKAHRRFIWDIEKEIESIKN